MQDDFLYEPVCDAAGCQLSVTVLADRDHVRAEMRADAASAGFRILDSCSLEEYAQGPLAALGDLDVVQIIALFLDNTRESGGSSKAGNKDNTCGNTCSTIIHDEVLTKSLRSSKTHPANKRIDG